jgi:ABC-type polysaccharide/polyol phosphate transport system ATPase subunit
MSPDGTINAHRLWKRFHADRKRSIVHHEITRVKAQLRGQHYERWRWALRDVNVAMKPGESVGLIGANGSGKSTLLKILTRVMYPYAGRLEVHGRVGALIEVSAGIHPQLTGRENAFLYGSLLGLSRKEVADRFDEIVEFAELETAIDRQVKFYSSGMRMRLGFAVAAFLEPDILLVDEALAVGDATFQQKCLDRMRAVLAQGTTLVFVSHDLAAVEATCARGVWLDNGVVVADGEITDTLGRYRRAIEEVAAGVTDTSGFVDVKKVEVVGADGDLPATHGPLQVRAVFDSPVTRSASLHIGISEGTATPIFVLRRDVHLLRGENEILCRMENLPLPRGRYYLWVSLWHLGEGLSWRPVCQFDVAGPTLDRPPKAVVRLAPIHVEASWDIRHP